MNRIRLGILSSGTGWHVADLIRAASKLGHEAISLDFRRLSAAVAFPDKIFPQLDAVIVRTMPPGSLEQVVFRMDLLQRAELEGTLIVNSARCLETCVDKYLTSAKLHAAKLQVPPTIVCQNADAALEAFLQLGGDVIVKPLFGSEGRGMLRVSDPELAWRTFRTLERTGSVLYLQKTIQHPGWDLRVFVLGGTVLGAMRRYARPGDWRTNVAQGGTAASVTVDMEMSRMAIQAAEVVGAMASGVDLLQGTEKEWYVLEVNAVPGWRSFAPVTQIDVAEALIRFVAARVKR